jgi:hypothetical protein
MNPSLDRAQFVSWLSSLPDDHQFSFCWDNDPVSQFIRDVLKIDWVCVGLDWYSIQKPIYAKKPWKPEGYINAPQKDGTIAQMPYYNFMSMYEQPITDTSALPKWLSTIMWDKRLKADFTKETLLKFHPKLAA